MITLVLVKFRSPQVFLNGVPGTVETNGTKLDRAQVFLLPEVEYVAAGDEEHGVLDGGREGERWVCLLVLDQIFSSRWILDAENSPVSSVCT